MFTARKFLGGLAGVGLLVLGSAANAVVISNPVLTYGNATFLGTITPGGGSPTTEGNNVNFLRTLAAGSAPVACAVAGDVCGRVGSTLLGAPFSAVTAGGKQDNGNTSVNLGTAVFQYILGKYDAGNAGSWVWYNADGFTGTVTMPANFQPISQQGLSHTTYFSRVTTTSSSGGLVPEPGTMGLFGLGLLGLGFLRRAKRTA